VVTEDVILEAGRTLARAATSPARVILFGSWARGNAGPESDLDFLVIEEVVGSKVDEMVRLRDALPPLGVPVDVLVVSQAHADDWASVRGTMVHAALSEGRVLVDR
jgi:predicted nucleotidyltransferase